MDFQALMGKLGRNGQVQVGGALLVFILSFLPWYSVSFSVLGHTDSASASAWDAGIGAWFPVLLLVAVGVVTVLSALGTVSWAPLMLAAVTTGGALVAAVIIVLRWLTFPSGSSDASDAALGVSGSAGAGWALYVSLVLAVAMAVFGYLGFAAAGGDVKNIGAAFKSDAPSVTPPQG